MTLKAREQQALDAIQDRLANSDPRLAALLAAFTMLVSDEEMPIREQIRTNSWRAFCCSWRARRPPRTVPRRNARLGRRYFGFPQAALLLWAVITALLVVTALMLSSGATHGPCPAAWPVLCGSSVHVHKPNLKEQERTARRTPGPGRMRETPGG